MIPIRLIEADVLGRSFEPVKVEARPQEMVWEIVQPGPFLNGLVAVGNGHRLTDNDGVVFSGTFPLMRHIQLHDPWIPGGWCTAERFDCLNYYPCFGRHLRNHAHAILTLEKALSEVGEIFAQFGRGGTGIHPRSHPAPPFPPKKSYNRPCNRLRPAR